MTRIHVDSVIDAAPDAVWAGIEDVGTHVEWMAEAVEIRFLTEQRSGVGTTIECDTRIGPLTTTDVLRFVEWEPPRVMGIEHVGMVRGEGRFTLEPLDGGRRTRFVWDEDLSFPARLGGPLGARLGAPVIRRIWRRNLARLKAKVEAA